MCVQGIDDHSIAKSIQSCPTLCDPIDGSPPGSPIPGIKSLSRVRLLATPWTAAYQAPPSMGFSRQEYWSGVPMPSLKINIAAAAAAKSLQPCLTLGDPIDGSPPGSPIPGILQARTLEWVAISFSSA